MHSFLQPAQSHLEWVALVSFASSHLLSRGSERLNIQISPFPQLWIDLTVLLLVSGALNFFSAYYKKSFSSCSVQPASGWEPRALIVVNNWKCNRVLLWTCCWHSLFHPVQSGSVQVMPWLLWTLCGTGHQHSLFAPLFRLSHFTICYSVNLQSNLEFTVWDGLGCTVKVFECVPVI